MTINYACRVCTPIDQWMGTIWHASLQVCHVPVGPCRVEWGLGGIWGAGSDKVRLCRMIRGGGGVRFLLLRTSWDVQPSGELMGGGGGGMFGAGKDTRRVNKTVEEKSREKKRSFPPLTRGGSGGAGDEGGGGGGLSRLRVWELGLAYTSFRLSPRAIASLRPTLNNLPPLLPPPPWETELLWYKLNGRPKRSFFTGPI